ncbi:MAG TPA: glycoside hydrolase family 30 beta sandwich domain-containing protein [Anaerolineales bacterium]|nr:glycoside hydrolase family 30 beta sandwich domain-containing protein [Anaerolineales bacterium]
MSSFIRAFRTAKDTPDRLTEKAPLAFQKPSTDAHSILVDAGTRFQTIEGFGGAFTEAGANTFYKMSPEIRSEIINAYFDPVVGNKYTLCRTHINSCDFSLGNYAYTEMPGDIELKHFSIERDRHQLIPMIKEAICKVDGTFKLMASPWSPPAWMKTNGQMNHGGKLKPEYRQTWANYFVRYIQEYENEGIKIWGLTVQNEPLATQVWDSCIYTGEEERDFVRDYLGPALEQAGLLDRIKLLIWDHNRDMLYERAKVVYDDPAASRFVWGAAFHWYVGDHFDNVRLTHEAYPDKKLLFSEGCQEGGPHYDDWEVGERYGQSMIHDLNHWTTAWIDWNLLLDQRGGPNHGGNYCSAPLMADYAKGSLYYHNSYYYIGQVTRFVRPGAQRIISTSTLDELETAAFLNPDGQIAVVVLNRADKSFDFAIKYNGQVAMTESPAHSISTFCFPSE